LYKIVHKRHITFAFGDELLARSRELFESGDWQVEALPGYSAADRVNPFTTFAAIPAKARYQFMLDNAEYFTRTFIRGPVCRGQVATDLIRDQFWTVFQDPEHDLFITNPEYRDAVTPLLALPGQNSALLDLGDNWSHYKDKRNRYHEQRNVAYQMLYPAGASLDHIWDGDGDNTNALLTIFRPPRPPARLAPGEDIPVHRARQYGRSSAANRHDFQSATHLRPCSLLAAWRQRARPYPAISVRALGGRWRKSTSRACAQVQRPETPGSFPPCRGQCGSWQYWETPDISGHVPERSAANTPETAPSQRRAAILYGAKTDPA